MSLKTYFSIKGVTLKDTTKVHGLSNNELAVSFDLLENNYNQTNLSGVVTQEQYDILNNGGSYYIRGYFKPLLQDMDVAAVSIPISFGGVTNIISTPLAEHQKKVNVLYAYIDEMIKL